MIDIGNDWDYFFMDESEKDYYNILKERLLSEYNNYTVYPNSHDIFNAFKLTPISSVKVVILGQDPYHDEGQAMGLAFSVPNSIKAPPSLKNIFKEIESDIGVVRCNNDLSDWATQGVLLLNTCLTVREHQPNSHRNIGWENMTDNIIKMLNESDSPKVFILWGNNAIKKEKLITSKNHAILKSAHPSPLSAYRGFFGCKHFSRANDFLIKNNIIPINW